MELVVCAAIQLNGGEIVCGVRHFDKLMYDQLLNLPDNPHGSCSEQGFVNNRGEFLSREEAWIVAEKAGQIIRRVGGDGKELYSENLY